MVGEPHGAEVTGKGGRREQGAAGSVQLHADTSQVKSVYTCTQISGQFIIHRFLQSASSDHRLQV